jgi:hypothetical protein
MVGNAEAFIDKLRAHFGDPKLADGVDEAVFLADYLKELRHYSESCLHLAATQLITTRDRRTFPTLAECLKVCRDVHEKLAAEVPPPPNKDHWPEHSEKRVKKADRLIQCPLGRQAADEGWIMGLHEFCRETGKLPDRYEAERVKAKLMAQLAERRPIEAVGGRHVAAPLFRAWRQREERLKKLVYGTPSTDASGQAA